MNHDLIENVDAIVYALHEEHAHRVDVEIDGPYERMVNLKADRLEVDGGIESVVDAIAAGTGELGFKFLAIRLGIELAGCAAEFLVIDHATLRGGELKNRPIGIGLGVLKMFKKVIAALGSADEESTAVAVGERGKENLRPGLGTHRSELIEYHQIETIATKRVRTVGAADGDG